MKRNEKKRAGFTMVELVAVLIILGLLMGLVAKNFIGKIDDAKVTTTRANLKSLHESVLQFKMDTGRYPTDEEGLNALIEQPTDVTNWQQGGYLETTTIRKDAWKNDFVFQLNPESGKPFVIISYGADGQPEGEGNNADLYSTD